MDKISPAARSRNMSKITSINTKPELTVRKKLFQRGLRYRIHYKIAGKPDIVFPSKKIAIFIQGCFWHGHKNCNEAHIPKTNSSFWQQKIERNIRRDTSNLKKLELIGWKVIILYECEIEKNLELNLKKIQDLLQNRN